MSTCVKWNEPKMMKFQKLSNVAEFRHLMRFVCVFKKTTSKIALNLSWPI